MVFLGFPGCWASTAMANREQGNAKKSFFIILCVVFMVIQMGIGLFAVYFTVLCIFCGYLFQLLFCFSTQRFYFSIIYHALVSGFCVEIIFLRVINIA